jgi:hypothetical protein
MMGASRKNSDRHSFCDSTFPIENLSSTAKSLLVVGKMKRAAMKRLASWRPGGVLVFLVFVG